VTIGTQTDVCLSVVFQPDHPAVHFLKTGEWKLPPHNGIPNISEFSGSSVEPDHSTSSLTVVPCISSLFTAPPIERRPLPHALRKYLSPNLTTSGPSAADTTISGSSAVQVTVSGPSAVHLTTSGHAPLTPRHSAPAPTSPPPPPTSTIVHGFLLPLPPHVTAAHRLLIIHPILKLTLLLFSLNFIHPFLVVIMT